jgi:hypothetical protein
MISYQLKVGKNFYGPQKRAITDPGTRLSAKHPIVGLFQAMNRKKTKTIVPFYGRQTQMDNGNT